MSNDVQTARPGRWIYAVLVASLALNLAAGYGYWHMRSRLAQTLPVQAVVERLQLRPTQAELLVALRSRVQAEVKQTLQSLGETERQRLNTLLATVAADDVRTITREFGALAQQRLQLQIRIIQETLRFRDGLDEVQRARFNQALTERGFVAQLAGLTPAQAGVR